MKNIIGLIVWLGVLSVPFSSFGARLSDEDLAKKKEGWYPTGLPLVNFSTDAGLGYGARVFGYNNGLRTDPHFDETPYFMQVYGQFFQTTGGQAYHQVDLDMPFLAGTEYRLRARAGYDAILNANYFGNTAAAADVGLVGADGQVYNNWDSYSDHLASGDVDSSLRKFNNYQRNKFYGWAKVSRPILDWLEAEVGLEFGKTSITDWYGETGTYEEVEETFAETRLTKAQQAGEINGYDGGFVNYLHLGLRMDQRDFEPNPKTGYLAEYNLSISGKFLGSEFEFVRQTMAVRGYYTFWDRLTLAGRLAMTYSSGDVPFFEMTKMSFMKADVASMGGIRTGRGYLEERFIARGHTLAQVDVRYTVGELVIWGQRFGFQPFAFFDAGNVYDSFGDIFAEPRFGSYHPSYGGGFVIPWNLTTILHYFVGFSPEGMSLSIGFDHAF